MTEFFSLEHGESRIDGLRIGWMTIKSPALKARADVTVIIPNEAEKLGPLPVYTFLHGIYGSHWAWAIKGNLHKTANELFESGTAKAAIILMPSDGLWGDGSGYIDHGLQNFENWILEDILSGFQESWPNIDASGERCISGLSMGGFGALYLGAKYPTRFKAISAHSSVTQLSQLKPRIESPFPNSINLNSPEFSVIHWLNKNKNSLPPLRFDCGLEDPLIEHNQNLHSQLSDLDISHSYEEFPGDHSWPYWETYARKSLQFFAQHS